MDYIINGNKKILLEAVKEKEEHLKNPFVYKKSNIKAYHKILRRISPKGGIR